MKRTYESPAMYGEMFVANQYVAACGDTWTEIKAMEVRCQSDGHLNTAKDKIFMDSTSCVGKYDPNLTDDNCHSQRNHAGEREYGTGLVWGEWGTKDIGRQTVDWFYEAANGANAVVQAFKGFFYQEGHRHLFYASTSQAEEYQLS
ncbi:MAG: hypothetical protein Q4F18_10065 [Clostridia bacterium]|nr:hypothetical protein [Clostridia bacterium]